jgi:hypothetical protein
MTTTNTKTTNYVQLPKVVNQEELVQRQQDAKDSILNGYYKPTSQGGFYIHPAAAETQSFNNPDTFLEFIESQAKTGIPRYPHIPVLIQGSLYQVTYFKNQEELNTLLLQAEQEAEQTYKVEIEEHNNNQIALLTSQMLATAQRKEDRKEEERQSVAHAKALAEATAFINSQIKEVI